ncbi:MAG: hypothetical protein QY330_01955 [Candidatus Dojkabacteria bacterium]|uniref:Uncharacterized protein n=1 Tax=candidate division WS6 bacterium OLB21 TaxID=1617427 RepID=A0A136KJI3_9BACT|nr:MAG: hypothetical protein UZ20_WS6002000385 [candidate division WS6 bacterium OLB21]WKZ28351.1 MAG: hypothetical protein QY330_01955 [Candidatus Dojkabacteria bacterium]
MSKISTRTRIAVISSLLTVAYVLLQQRDFRVLLDIDFPFDPIKPVLLAILIYLGAYWALFFKVRGERFITILLFPAIGVFSISLFAELIILTVFSELGQLSLILVSAVFFWLFSYIILLTVNILNAAYNNPIPLLQAARAAQFVLTLVISYFFFFLLFSNDIFLPFRLIAIHLISGLLVYITLWSLDLFFYQRLTVSLAMGTITSFAAAIVSIWPVSAPYLALAQSIVLYICLGISLEVRDIISKWIWIEYLSLFVLIVIMLALVAEWGINGTLL